MSLTNLTGLGANVNVSRSMLSRKKTASMIGSPSVGRTVESSITYYNAGSPIFTVKALKRSHPGMKGNKLNFGLVRVDGARYVIFLFEDDNDKLDGTLSTAGQAAGATTAAGIVNKINTSAMNAFLEAILHNNATNIDYTGHSAVNLANTDPLKGGRG